MHSMNRWSANSYKFHYAHHNHLKSGSDSTTHSPTHLNVCSVLWLPRSWRWQLDRVFIRLATSHRTVHYTWSSAASSPWTPSSGTCTRSAPETQSAPAYGRCAQSVGLVRYGERWILQIFMAPSQRENCFFWIHNSMWMLTYIFHGMLSQPEGAC